jgi:hypothetical protein
LGGNIQRTAGDVERADLWAIDAFDSGGDGRMFTARVDRVLRPPSRRTRSRMLNLGFNRGGSSIRKGSLSQGAELVMWRFPFAKDIVRRQRQRHGRRNEAALTKPQRPL